MLAPWWHAGPLSWLRAPHYSGCQCAARGSEPPCCEPPCRARAGHAWEAPRSPCGPGRGGTAPARGESPSRCLCWLFQLRLPREAAGSGSADSPPDNACLRTGALVPVLCSSCHWEPAEPAVPVAWDRQPCPHTAPKGQTSARPVGAGSRYRARARRFHHCIRCNPDANTHVSGAQRTWLWPTAITSLDRGFSGFPSLSQAEPLSYQGTRGTGANRH